MHVEILEDLTLQLSYELDGVAKIEFYSTIEDMKKVIVDYDYSALEQRLAFKVIQAEQDMVKGMIQQMLDSEARKKGYDSIVSACSYAGYPNIFQQEAIVFGTWRSSVWAYVYQVEQDILNGIRTKPTLEELVTELPTIALI